MHESQSRAAYRDSPARMPSRRRTASPTASRVSPRRSSADVICRQDVGPLPPRRRLRAVEAPPRGAASVHDVDTANVLAQAELILQQRGRRRRPSTLPARGPMRADVQKPARNRHRQRSSASVDQDTLGVTQRRRAPRATPPTGFGFEAPWRVRSPVTSRRARTRTRTRAAQRSSTVAAMSVS